MSKLNGGRLTNIFASFLASVLAVTAVVCTFIRVNELNAGLSIQMLASSLSMPQSAAAAAVNPPSKTKTTDAPVNSTEQPVQAAAESTAAKSDDEITDDESKYKGDKLPVVEQHFGSSGEDYGNFSVKNSTDYDIDYESFLSSDLGFKIEDTKEPQVLIVHTHTTESYLINDNGYYYTDYPFRSKDSSRNMVAVGKKIKEALKKNGISAVQADKIHDETYTGSYDRSEQTIYEYMEKYPSIRVILDIHRDAVGYDDERGKYKPTFTYNGKKAAQIMIMSGYDPYDNYGLGHWQENLTFALKLQQKAEDMYPGMTRPLYFGDFAYNMFINNGSLLIEVGTETNTLSEAQYTGELLGNVLSSVLNDNKG